MDLDNLEPTPDIDNIDLAAMDRGDQAEAPEPEVEAPAPEAEAPAAEAEPEAAEAAPRDERGKFAGIPKARFDEAVGKERDAREAAERRASALEQQLAQRATQIDQSAKSEEAEARIATLEAQHSSYLLDGEADKATEAMREIRQMERQLTRAEMRAESQVVTANTLESDRVELSIAQLEANHPVLNPASEDYNESLVNFVLAEQQRLMKTKGLSPSHALTAAAKDVVDRYATPRTAAEDKAGLSSAQGDRKAAAVQKNLATMDKQPASMKDVGLDSDKAGQNAALPDVSKMTAEEFAALPKSTLARLRGDYL